MDAALHAADDWWHSLDDERRVRLWRWLADQASISAGDFPVAGQFEIPFPPERKVTR